MDLLKLQNIADFISNLPEEELYTLIKIINVNTLGKIKELSESRVDEIEETISEMFWLRNEGKYISKEDKQEIKDKLSGYGNCVSYYTNLLKIFDNK